MDLEYIDLEYINKVYKKNVIIRNLATVAIFAFIPIFVFIPLLAMSGVIMSNIIRFIFDIKCKAVKSVVLDGYVHPKLDIAFEKFGYSEGDGESKEIVKSSGIIDLGTKIIIRECFYGYYRGVKFTQIGVDTQYIETDNYGITTITDKFGGRLIIIEASLFDNEGIIKIMPHSDDSSLESEGFKKTTLNNEVDEYYDIYVSDEGLSLPEAFLNHIVEMARIYQKYTFNFKIEKDKIYMSIDNIIPEAYNVKSIYRLSKKNMDSLIKKDSYFITNTISSILD